MYLAYARSSQRYYFGHNLKMPQNLNMTYLRKLGFKETDDGMLTREYLTFYASHDNLVRDYFVSKYGKLIENCTKAIVEGKPVYEIPAHLI